MPYNYVDDVPDNLLCPITREPLEDPIELPCGKSALEEHFEQSQTCPNCRQPASKSDWRPVKALIILQPLDELKLSCVHACGWEGERGNLQDHLRTTCPAQNVSCSRSDEGRLCNWMGRRSDLENHHQTTCPFETVSFSHAQCTWTGLRKLLDGHLRIDGKMEMVQCYHGECTWSGEQRQRNEHLNTTCPAEEVHCLHKDCGWAGRRSDQETHLATTCIAELVSCQFALIAEAPACNHEARRDTMSSHTASCPFRALAPFLEHLVTSNRTLQRRVDTLEAELQSLKPPPEPTQPEATTPEPAPSYFSRLTSFVRRPAPSPTMTNTQKTQVPVFTNEDLDGVEIIHYTHGNEGGSSSVPGSTSENTLDI